MPYSLARYNHDSAAKYKKYVTYDNYIKLLSGKFDIKVIAVLYGEYGRFVDAKMYDAAETVQVKCRT